jgi:DNA-binding MarR family transcriptional regulator
MFNNLKFLKPSPKLRELILLLHIERNPDVTQGRLASYVHLAPSMVNKYLKEFVSKKIIKKRGNNKKDMSYHLTESGRAYLNQLFSLFMDETLMLHRETKDEYRTRLQRYYDEGIKRIVFYGSADLAQISFNAAEEIGYEIIGVVDGDFSRHGRTFAGRRIEPPSVIENIKPDAVLIASFANREKIYQSISHLEEKGIRIISL